MGTLAFRLLPTSRLNSRMAVAIEASWLSALAAWFQNMNVPLEVSKHTPKSVVLVMEASTKKTEPSPYRVDISTQNACVCCIGSTICEASHHFDSIGGAGGGEGESYVASANANRLDAHANKIFFCMLSAVFNFRLQIRVIGALFTPRRTRPPQSRRSARRSTWAGKT